MFFITLFCFCFFYCAPFNLFVFTLTLDTTFHQIITSNSSSIIANITSLLIDVNEDVSLDCLNSESKTGNLHFEWYRKEEHWFINDLPIEKLFYNQRKVWINEHEIITVLYKCVTRNEQKQIVNVKLFRLYVDKLPRKKRGENDKIENELIVVLFTEISTECLPPKCKPYASVLFAHCDAVELNITYPTFQHGFNRSTDRWGNILCNDEIGGFMLWVVGHGILKRFRQQENYLIENLKPGRSYCFNGWAYNSCGAGPVFTLEGVCAINDSQCNTTSKENCQPDFGDFYNDLSYQ